ncbi:MAG: hypothetical protein Kow0098_18040 [Ignavibacteriaceae bacterium]
MRNLTLRISIMTFIILVAFYVIELIYFYPQLGENVITHIDISGNPDGWMSKDSAYIVFGFLLIILTAVFSGIYYIIPGFSEDMISIPNKEYWLKPERKEYSLNLIRSMILNIGSLTFALMIFVNYHLFTLNIYKNVKLNDYLLAAVIIYLILLLLIILPVIIKFSAKSGS